MFCRIHSNIFFITFFSLIFNFITLFGASSQYENKIVEKISIVLSNEEDSKFDTTGLKMRLKTKEGDHFSQIEFDNDLKTLIQDFDRIIPEINLINDKIEIVLNISLKPTIRTIYWTGNTQIKTYDLEQELKMAYGTIFDRQVFNKAFHKLKAYYVKEGFFEAELNYSVTLNSQCNEVVIEISIIEGRAGRIKKILFSGLDELEQEEIIDMMITKKYNFFTSWITNEGIYNEDAAMQDQFVILNYLQNKGYADARISIDPVQANQKNRIFICVNVTKGPKYLINAVTFEGNNLFCNEEIEQKILIKERSPYAPEIIRNTIDSITDLYGKFGYIDAYVDYEPRLEEDAPCYGVHFTIHEGEQFRVGLIKVVGNCSTQTNVILHETLLIPGQLFNGEKLKATETRLKNVGFFKNVNVYAVKSENAGTLGGNYRDVHIEVEETSTGHLGASLALSTTEGLFGGLNVTENNFNYRGLNRFFGEGYQAVRGAGEYLHLSATLGTKSRSCLLSWTKPYFRDTEWSVGFDLENSSTRYISDHYTINANSITLHGTNQLNPFVRLGTHYRLRDSTVYLSKKANKVPEEKKQLHHDGIISAAGLSLSYDSTDHPLRPTKGFKSKLESELAGLGGRYHFFSIAYINSFYIPTKYNGVLKFRGDIKFIDPILSTKGTDIPIDERLFLGGDNLVRGYKPYKLGPLFKKSHDPKGGLSLQFLSAEFTKRITKRLDAFAFIDSGHLSFDNWGYGYMYTAAGFGVKFQVFESGPPLQIGVGFPVNPKRNSDAKNFFLNIGGRF